MSAWQKVKLGQVLRHRKEFIQIDELRAYKRARVKLHAQGIVLRDEVPGALIKTKKQQVCQAGEFLVAEIDAKVGGFGIVPTALEGAIVSSHYFLFEIIEDRLERRFLDYYSRTSAFRDQVAAQGSTNYAAIRPADVLGYEIPLPPLPEQRRVVARIEEVAVQVREALAGRRDQEISAQRLLLSAFWKLASTAPRLPMSTVAPLTRRPVEVAPESSYPEVGIRSFGRGTFLKAPLSGLEVATKRIFRIEEGDLLFSNVFAWEGAIAVALAVDHGRFASHRFMTCPPVPTLATAEFLRFYFLTDEGMDLIRAASPGGAGRNRTLGVEALQKIEVPVPPIAEQEWFSDLSAQCASLHNLLAETSRDLDALVPATINRAFAQESRRCEDVGADPVGS